jgi:hypothetical protein
MDVIQGNLKLIWSLVFSLCGLALCLIALYYFRLAKQSKDWPSTTGIIISTGVSEVLKASDHYETELKPQICYAYKVGDDSYMSSRIGIMPNSSAISSATASKLTIKYPKDAQVSVYYNPDRPSQAVLEPGVNGNLIAFLIVAILIFAISFIAANHFGLRTLY